MDEKTFYRIEQVKPTYAELIESLREGSDRADEQCGLLAQAALALEILGRRYPGVLKEVVQYREREVRS